MFHNISNPKWFGNWSRLEDDYLGNGGTDIADNFTFSKMEKTGGLFGSIIRLATAFPACDPETGHATGAWKVACESIDLDEVPLSDIADMISGFDCETITDFRLFNTGAFDNTPWQQALGELLLRLRIEKDDYQWIQCPNSESAVNMMNMVMDAHMPKDFFDGFVCGDEEYGLNEEAHEMASGRKEIDTQTETKDAPEADADKEVKQMTDNFKEIGSLFGREGAGAGFAKQTDKESFTYAFAWPEGDTWATLTGYLNLDEQPKEYVRRVLQDGGFRSDWDNPDYDPIGDFKETAGDEYRIPLLKILLREQLESRYEVANHFSTMNRARVELSAFIQNEGGAPLPADALGTPEEQGIRAMLIATGEPPREVTLLPDKNGSTLKPLQALVGGNIETFDIAFGEGVSLYVNEEGLFTCPPNRAIFATEEMAKAGYLSQLDYSKVVEMGDFYTVLNGDIVAVGFDPETGESRSLTDGETARVEGYFTVISRPGSGAKAVDDIRHGITPGSYDISVESHDCTSGRNALAADAPARDAPGKDNQNIG